MSRHIRSLTAAIAALPALALAPAPPVQSVPDTPSAGVADHPVARGAAWWTDQQYTADGSVLGRTGSPDVGTTIAATLGMLSTGHTPTRLEAAVTFVTTNLEEYVTGDQGDRPGQLGNAILFTLATGDDPRDVAGSDLVARLEATEQRFPSPDAGRFGAQLDLFGQSYSHATAVLALALTPDVEPSPTSVAYLRDLQCAGGGFPSGYVTAVERLLDRCTGDTNTAGLAAAALAAVEPDGDAATGVAQFLAAARNTDGGWGFGPTSATDGNSTGLAGFGLAALHGATPLATSGAPGTLDALAGLQLDCTAGASAGALRYQTTSTGPDRFATFQGMLAFSASGLLDVIAAADPDPAEPREPQDERRLVTNPCG